MARRPRRRRRTVVERGRGFSTIVGRVLCERRGKRFVVGRCSLRTAQWDDERLRRAQWDGDTDREISSSFNRHGRATGRVVHPLVSFRRAFLKAVRPLSRPTGDPSRHGSGSPVSIEWRSFPARLITSIIVGRRELAWRAPWRSLARLGCGALRCRRTEASEILLNARRG